MKSMLAGFAVMAVLAVGAYAVLAGLPYTDAVRVEGESVRLD